MSYLRSLATRRRLLPAVAGFCVPSQPRNGTPHRGASTYVAPPEAVSRSPKPRDFLLALPGVRKLRRNGHYIKRKPRHVHNRFVFGTYSAIARRLMYGFTEEIVEDIRRRFQEVPST